MSGHFRGYPPPNLPPNPTTYLPLRPRFDPGLPPPPQQYQPPAYSHDGPPYAAPASSYSGPPPPEYIDRGPPRRDQFMTGRGGPPRTGRARSPDGRPRRRLGDRDHPSVEERIQRERPCRTLFIRNVTFEADADSLRASFASYGEIKTYFDLVKNRGMIFITYFDLRAAEKARDGMHDTQIGGRSIDVHYSLPRADEQTGRCDRDKNQGSIMVSLRHQRAINEFELGRLCETFGAIKTIRPCREPDQKIVEYYDSRGAALFYDEMGDKPFMNGTLDLVFVWDELDSQLPPPPAPERIRETSVISDQSRGGAARGPRRSGEGPGYGAVRGGGYRGPPDAGPPIVDRRESFPPGPPPPAQTPRYGELPPASPRIDDRLEQARKVQQLLATLGANAAPPPAALPPILPPAVAVPLAINQYNAPLPSRHPPQNTTPVQAQTTYGRPPANAYQPPSGSYNQAPVRPPNDYPPYRPPNASPPRPPQANYSAPNQFPMQHQGYQQRPPAPRAPPNQNYTPPSQANQPYRPQAFPPTGPPPNGPSYGQGQQGAAKDVGSLLAMLQSNR